MIIAWIGSIIFLVIAFLYLSLALGLPLGEFALGGKYKVLPQRPRIVCAVSVLVQLFAILVLSRSGNIISFGLSKGLSIHFCYFFSGYLFVNTLLNFASKSKKEKWVMTPLSLIVAICFMYVAVYA